MARRLDWSDDYRPLRVVAHMAAPVACVPGEPFLPLDAMLEYSAFRLGLPPVLKPDPARAGQHSRYVPRLSGSDPANFVLPLKRFGHKDDPDWCWRASWGKWLGGYEIDRQHWNKRFDGCVPGLGDHLDFGSRRGSVPVSSGRYKSYHMPLCLMVGRAIEWQCLGACDGVAQLLREIHHLGHKRGQGWGEVKRWEVCPSRVDLSFADEQGAPARALPVSYFTRGLDGFPPLSPDWPRMACAIRAPSWHPSRRRECVVPAFPAPAVSVSE